MLCTRNTPQRRKAASKTSSLPVSAPVCDVAALEDGLLRVSAMVEDNNQIAELDCVSGIDDLWYDTVRKRIYATGTDGLAVYDQKDADHYTPMVKVASAAGAATSIWVPTLGRLFVSAPQVGNGEAAILVFEAPR